MLRSHLLVVTVLSLCALLMACPIGSGPSEGEGEGEGEGEDYPEPDAFLVTPLGTDDVLEVGTFNIRNFPCGNSASSNICRSSIDSTASLVADVVYSLDVDLLAVQEIADVDAFDEVVDRLPNHAGVLSDHEYGDGTYQKIGFLYDTRRLTLQEDKAIFDGNFNFPRPPLEATFVYDDGANPAFTFVIIAVHLKAGGAFEDRERRTGAVDALESYVRGKVDGSGVDAVFVVGDYNESVDDAQGAEVFAPLLDAARYTVRTTALANQGQESFLGSNSIIDHIVSTVAVDDAATTISTVIPRLDLEVTSYRDRLSDHLPVFTKIRPR